MRPKPYSYSWWAAITHRLFHRYEQTMHAYYARLDAGADPEPWPDPVHRAFHRYAFALARYRRALIREWTGPVTPLGR